MTMVYSDVADLLFKSSTGAEIGRLRIYAPANFPEALQILDFTEAKLHGEEQVQLLEGMSYEYEVLVDLEQYSNVQLSTATGQSTIIKHSRITGGELADRGAIEPGLYTGLLSLTLKVDNDLIATAAVEVRSRKANYRDEYRSMLEDIAEYSTELLMNFQSPSQARFLSVANESIESIYQRFAFLKSTIGGQGFKDAIECIVAVPHRVLISEEQELSIRSRFAPSSRSYTQFARNSQRISLPTSHSLYSQMRSMGIDNPSIPEKIYSRTQRETTQTPENIFVKYVLVTFATFVGQFEHRISYLITQHPSDGNIAAYSRLLKNVQQLHEELLSALNRNLFKDLPEPDTLPLSSPVLQRKAGYREILQIWFQFNLAARLVWDGGDDVYTAGKRDVATLYEYWIFFQLLNIISVRLEFRKPPSKTLIEKTANGFGLKLKRGVVLSQAGLYSRRGRTLNIQFTYNRSFKVEPRDDVAGSWTRTMRPDFSLSIWPEGFTQAEAEQQELIVHIHFDAKYRAESVDDLFGEQPDELSEIINQQTRSTYKREDLLKMHAYRDAIRRTVGAYVIYPGDRHSILRRYHEILPGLGAFAVRPGLGTTSGIQTLSGFIDQVLVHMCDRVTLREQSTFHTNRIYHNSSNLKPIYEALPEKIGLSRTKPIAEQYILVAEYTVDEIRWMEEYGLFVITSQANLHTDIFHIDFIFVYDQSNGSHTIFQLQNPTISVLSDGDLRHHNYPIDVLNPVNIAMFVENASHFSNWIYDASSIQALQRNNSTQLLRLNLAEFINKAQFSRTK
jgi:predicted component of viral defense system (DUF524 family)